MRPSLVVQQECIGGRMFERSFEKLRATFYEHSFYAVISIVYAEVRVRVFISCFYEGLRRNYVEVNVVHGNRKNNVFFVFRS